MVPGFAGEHPRMGALDVCPFIPVQNVTMDDCVECAKEFGDKLAIELGVPGMSWVHFSVVLVWAIGWHSLKLFSSPEPSGLQGELIVYPYSGVRRRRCRCRQQCLNIFSSETALPIKAKFYVEPPWDGGTKVYINGPGHMTKMAAMPIYGKKL